MSREAGMDTVSGIDALYESARSTLGRLGAIFDTAVARTAALCAQNGKLNPALLDRHQWICYELALANAEFIAARTLVDAGSRASKLDAGLGLAFIADAIVTVLGKLEGIYIAVGIEAKGLQDLSAGTELRQLRYEAARPDVLENLGLAVAHATGELADVPVDEQTILARNAFRKFAADVVAPFAGDIHRHDLTVPETILRPLRDMGVFGLSIPEEYGGSLPAGHENTGMMIAVTEALSEASLAAAGSLITRPEILARALMAGGTDEQKALWLPKIAAGDPLCAIAITEPDHGSDVAGLSLRATRTEDGWILNGAKTWCTFAGKAGVLMVVARTDPDRSLGHRGLSLMLVEKPSCDGQEFSYSQERGGILHGRAIPTIGYRGMHSFDLTFEDFFVPADNLIGGGQGLGRGFYLTMAGMMGGRIQTAGRALGVMRAAINAAVQYSKDREVFGAPLIDFPLTRIKIATMAARFAGCRHLAYAVGRLLDGGGGRMEASLAKLLACRSAETVTREALQIHGGMGYAEESAVSRYWVDARVLSIFEGAEETLALKVIAKSLLEAALSP